MVSAGFLYAKGDPSGVADRPFFVRMVGSLAERRVPRSAERERNESATRALSRRRQAWNMRPAGEETRAAEVEPTWENGGFKLEKIVVNAYLTLSVAVNLRCPRVKVQRLV